MPYKYRWVAITAIGFSMFMIAVDMNIVALALPLMARAFGQPDAAMSAVIVCYALPLTLLLLPYGMRITHWRPLPTFLVGVLGFAAASGLCAIAPSFGWLLGGRVAQGIFGALIVTQGVALAAHVVAPHELGRAMGIIAAIGPLGAAAGPGIGGLLLSAWGWPSIFLINMPISIVAMVLACVSLRGVTFDGQHQSSLQPFRQLLGRVSFVGALLTLLLATSVGGGLIYLLPFALQDIQQVASATAGTTLLFFPLGMAATSPVSGYLTDRYGSRRVLLAGIILRLVGLFILLLAISTPTASLDLIWRLLLLGVTQGLIAGPLQTLLMSIGPGATVGAASAMSNIARQLGFTCGPVVISMLWAVQVGAPAAERMVGGMITMLVLAGLAVLSTVYTFRRLMREGGTVLSADSMPASSAGD